MANQPELILQQKCYKYFHNTYPELRGCMWRVENERVRSRYEMMIAISTGLVSGVADLNFIHNGTFHAIELKTEKGRQSKSQLEWQKKVEQQGAKYHVIRSFEQFKEFVDETIQKNTDES